MFYAIAKRRRDLNAAEDKGIEKGREEGLEEGIQRGVTALDAVAARLSEPGADPVAVIAQLRAELRNGAGH